MLCEIDLPVCAGNIYQNSVFEKKIFSRLSAIQLALSVDIVGNCVCGFADGIGKPSDEYIR